MMSRRILAIAGVGAIGLLAGASCASAQGAIGVGNIAATVTQATRLAITQAVTQATASLPPAAGQSFLFEWDPALDTYVRSSRLGPTTLRSPTTLGKGTLSLRMSASYFSLSKTADPIDYQVTGGGSAGLPNALFTKFGDALSARVGLIDASASYGLTDTLEFTINVPITIVSARASSTFVSPASAASVPPGEAPVAAATSVAALDRALGDGRLIYRTGTLNELGASFNDGTSAGVGRISLSFKTPLVRRDDVDVAASLDVFLPSGFESNFSGPNTGAFLPRLIGSAAVTRDVKLYGDVGYNFDSDIEQLRSFVWTLGAAYAGEGFTLDTGVSGSLYAKGLELLPSKYTNPPSQDVNAPLTFTALSNTELGTNYIDFLFGAKLQVFEDGVITGAVSVPVTNDGVQPVAIGSVSFEAYF